MKRIFTLILLCSPIFFFAQKNQEIKTAIETHSQSEKVYLHLDRDYYTAGGDIFFKVYLTDETLRQQQSKSKVVYVDLISPDQEIVKTKTIAIKAGQGVGDFKITSQFKSGFYVLRAYTRYMKNFDAAFFFRKSIYIRGVTNLAASKKLTTEKIAIQFMPEGGDLVMGLSSKIALKATNAQGLGIALKGHIKDNTGETIKEISTNDKGFGLFNLLPKSGQNYVFEGNYDGQNIQQALPQALSTGVVLSADISVEEQIKLNLLSSAPTLLREGYIIGHGMGQVFLNEPLTKSKKHSFELEVIDLPFGILHFTVFDGKGQPRAERLVFNHDGTDNFNVDITLDKAAYGKREKVTLKMELYDDEGEVFPADLSMSVVHGSLQAGNDNQDNIQSYLLLSSDIKGLIEVPTTYFKDQSMETRKALDLLLMTQGWRRFHWQDILKTPNKEWTYLPEQGLSLSGKITQKGDATKPVKAVGYLSELSANLSMIDFQTDENGQFFIENLQASNPTDMVIQAATLDKKQAKVKAGTFALKGNRNIQIKIDERNTLAVGQEAKDVIKLAGAQKEQKVKLSNVENIKYQNDLGYEDGEWSIDIDSVEVTGEKIDKIIEYYEDGMLYKRPDTRVKMDETIDLNSHNNIFTVLEGKAPGTSFDPQSGQVIIRGKQTGLSANVNISNGAKFMVNGALVSPEYANSINPMNVAFIDVIRSLSKLAIYGDVGSNGLIMIYLKPPEEQQRAKKEVEGIANFSFKGYDAARTFYTPTYNITNRENGKPDNRITLHWIPTLRYDEMGEAVTNFYTSDRLGTFDILIEGLSADGLPIIAKSTITVR